MDKVSLVVFDVDGTLYNQRKLRFFILIEMLTHYIVRPHKYYELIILWSFRRERERHSMLNAVNSNISTDQYLWCQAKVKRPTAEIQAVVEEWIYKRPLKYLRFCIYKYAPLFIHQLKRADVITSVYSDYRAEQKLAAMQISVDHIFSSEQKEIDVLKPNPKGLNFIAEKLNVSKQCILYIGDRMELDGICAKHAHIAFLHLKKGRANSTYKKLIKWIQVVGNRNNK